MRFSEGNHPPGVHLMHEDHKEVPAVEEIGKERCTGCFACASACPVGAVALPDSGEGFYLAEVDKRGCSGCGICRKHCPVLSTAPATNRTESQVRAYAAWSGDEAVRRSSSSGGLFTSLARAVLARGGTVFGVAWDGTSAVHHVRVSSEAELQSLRGSKYLPSRVGDAYLQAVSDLREEGGPVLFSGLPCQVAALHTFVRDDRLLTVDLVCHGVPSFSVFRRYLAHVAGGRTVARIDFRDKREGWARFSLTVHFLDGTEHSRTFRSDPFMRGFLGDLYLNAACHRCPFCRMPRQGDLTLADYWGVARELRSELGISLVLSNNEKGDAWIGKLEGCTLRPTPFEAALRGNPRLVEGTLPVPQARSSFFRDLERLDFSQLIELYIEPEGENRWLPSPSKQEQDEAK